MDKARAAAILKEALVWDTHSGFTPDPSAELENLREWRDAGVDYLSINVGFDVLPWSRAIETLAAFRHWVDHSDDYTLVESVEDVRRAKAAGKMAIAFDLEGMNALEGRVEMVEVYYRLGVRQMLFAYNRNNLAGGGCHDDDRGLTDFGRAVIDEMNRLGMFVDVSHCGHRTSMEAMAYSKRPVIFSHSNARALCDHERNIRDDQIAACAAGGGVIGVAGINHFLGVGSPVERLADHVEYLVERAGPQHVGIGLDYAFPVGTDNVDDYVRTHPEYWPPDRYEAKPVTFMPPAQLLDLTAILLDRGQSEETIRGVLGENFLRVAGQVW
jgi:membrane dipeptidase